MGSPTISGNLISCSFDAVIENPGWRCRNKNFCSSAGTLLGFSMIYVLFCSKSNRNWIPERRKNQLVRYLTLNYRGMKTSRFSRSLYRGGTRWCFVFLSIWYQNLLIHYFGFSGRPHKRNTSWKRSYAISRLSFYHIKIKPITVTCVQKRSKSTEKEPVKGES